MKALVFLFSLLLSTPPALAEEVNTWEEVSKALNAGEEVVLLPLPSEIGEFQEQPPPPQPELHFSGDNGEGGTSVAQAMLTLPPISVGGQSAISPFFALNGQSDGTRQLTLSVEGGFFLSIGDRGQLQFSIEEMVHPVHITSFKMNAVLRF